MTEISQDFPRMKICGITRLEDALLACALGAWAIGFVFYNKSPRATSPENVGQILLGLRDLQARRDYRTVGVFVNPTLQELICTIKISGINTVQLHGDESPLFCSELRRALQSRFPEIQIIKAMRLREREDLASLSPYSHCCEAILLDADSSQWGGSGKQANWDWAALASQDFRVILAGGLNPENIQEALEKVKPFAVDASSGLERVPGEKASEKVKEFFRKARERGCKES